jgi:ankyrin repeat protein
MLTKILKNNGWTPLHAAANEGHLNVCKILIESGAEQYPKSNDGKTPLELAAQESHTEVESFLRNLRKRHWGPPIIW